jgi:hypothetical protein
MTPDEHWLATLWPLVRAHLPAPPARVVDIGCGPLGGFVPLLHSNGYDAAGVDPKAPDIADYHRIEFEHLELPERVDALIASTCSPRDRPAEVIDRLTTAGGAMERWSLRMGLGEVRRGNRTLVLPAGPNTEETLPSAPIE